MTQLLLKKKIDQKMIRIWMKSESNEKIVTMEIWIIINLESLVDSQEKSEIDEIQVRKATEKSERKDENPHHERLKNDEREENLRKISSMR